MITKISSVYIMKYQKSKSRTRRKSKGGAYTCKQLYDRDRDGFDFSLAQRAKFNICKYILARNAYRNHKIDQKWASEPSKTPRTTKVRLDMSKNKTLEIPNVLNQGGSRRSKRSRKTRRKRKSSRFT